jgi:hypothetical protein
MKNFIEKGLKAVRSYTVWDWGWLKITLFSLGLIVGTYFSSSLLNCILVIWVLFLFSCIYIAYKTFISYWIL